MPAPIELYYFGSPNSRKITIMLEELNAPYTLVPIMMSRGDTKRDDYNVLAPSQKMPVIVDPEGPDGRPISVFESGAILKYLAEKYGRFYGASTRERVKIDEWLFWQVGGFGPMLGQANHFSRYAREKIPYAIDRYVNETHRLYRVLDTQLGKQAKAGRDYVAGDDVSIADFAILDWSNGYANYAIDEAEFPHWLAWRARMKARPGVARALAFTLPEKPVDIAKDDEAQKVLFGQR